MIPLYKNKGSKLDASSYSPISLAPCLLKIFENCLLSLLKSYEIHKLNSNQHGFIAGKFTLSYQIESYQRLAMKLDLGIASYIIYLDLSKAFDRVPHDKLQSIMIDLGVLTRLINIILNVIGGRVQRVKVGS